MFINPLFKEHQKNMKITTLTLTEDELEAVFLGLIGRSDVARIKVDGDEGFNDYWRAQARHAQTAISKCQAAYDNIEDIDDAYERKLSDLDRQTFAALMAVKDKIMNALVAVNGQTADCLDRNKPITKFVGQAQGLIDAIAYIEEAAMSYDNELPF